MSTDTTPGYLRIATIQACAVDDVRVTDALLRMLNILGSYASEQNSDWLWASQERMARRMGITRQAVGQMCLQLETLGYVQIQERHRDDGGRASNWVRLIMDFHLSEEYMRSARPRKRAGVGGRPILLTPETPLSFTPLKLPEVSPPETPQVSPPETLSEFQQKLEKETRKETGRKKRVRAASTSTEKKSAKKSGAEPEVSPPLHPLSLDAGYVWTRAVNYLRAGRLGSQELASWIVPLRLVALERSQGHLSAYLIAPGTDHVRIVEHRYHGALASALGSVYGLPASRVDVSIAASVPMSLEVAQ